MGAVPTRPPPHAVILAGRSLMRLCGVILSLLLTVCPAAAESLEYSVKANYLVRFAAFVNWPPEAFATPTSSLTICVIGVDPFGPSLTKAAAGQTINGRAAISSISAVRVSRWFGT